MALMFKPVLEAIKEAKKAGIKIVACEVAMANVGLQKEESHRHSSSVRKHESPLPLSCISSPSLEDQPYYTAYVICIKIFRS
ncbi:MAG: hypothetical protein RXQ22_05225 [Sulfolobus sp.]